jgi:hypothetical protein
MLPYMEQEKAYKQFDLTLGPDHPTNQLATNYRFRHIVCPSSGEYDRQGDKWKSSTPLTHYVGMAGVGNDAATLEANNPRAGVFGYDRSTSIEHGIPDGLSNTLLLIETAREPGHWAFGGPATVRGVEPSTSPYVGPGRPFGGFHDSGWVWRGDRRHTAMAALADGSTRSLSDSISPEVLEALATVGGTEQIPADW